MAERRILVAANWKLNGDKSLVSKMSDALNALELSNIDVVITPSFPYLACFEQANNSFSLCAQNVSEHESGAYTGEVSIEMLKELGCEYVIIGHSERRTIFNESDELICKKFELIKAKSLKPIFCIGETEGERESDETENVISRQVNVIIDTLGVEALENSVIAYEPVWAIGTGKTASPEQAQDVHHFIRTLVAKKSAVIADKLQILYGGSVNASNCETLFSQSDIDGGLIGGASLKPDEFSTVCRLAQGIK